MGSHNLGVTHAFPPRADTMPHKGGGDKAGEFFKAIGVQKQDTIRWSFNYGGISVFTRDDDGYTGLQVSVVLRPASQLGPHVHRSCTETLHCPRRHGQK